MRSSEGSVSSTHKKRMFSYCMSYQLNVARISCSLNLETETYGVGVEVIA